MLVGLAATLPAQFSFSLLSNLPANDAGANVADPSSIRLVDLDGDGNLDYVVGFAQAGTTNLQIRYGLGGGAFDAPVYVRTAVNPRKVVVGQGNGDTNMDLFAVCPAANAVSFIINANNRNFAPHQDYIPGLGYSPRDMVVTDLNSDGTNDMVFANFGNNSVTVYLGIGNDTFVVNATIPLGAQPVALVADDFNLDGRVDLAVLHNGGGAFSILFGYQDGTFATPFATSIGGAAGPSELGVDDFDHDGYPDLLVVKSAAGMIVGLRNNEFGFFTPAVTNLAPQGVGLKVADLNNDKIHDLIIGLNGGNQIRIFPGLNTLTGGYGAPLDFTVENGPASVDAGDVNGDGVADLVVANLTSGTISVLLNETPVAIPMKVTMDEDAVGGLPFTLLGTTNVPLTYTIVTAPLHGLVSQPTAGGPDVLYEPDADFFGTDFFEYVVDDGLITSLRARVYITVLPVNDEPSFVLPASQTVTEDWRGGGINYFATSISVGPANERGQAYRFYVYNDNPALFAVPPYMLVGGKLIFTPAKDANGFATVDVVMEDTGGVLRGGVNRATNSFTLFVDAVNDAPTFKLTTNRVVVAENAAPVVMPGFAVPSPGPADEAGQTLDDFVITRNTNPGLFAAGPVLTGAGELSFTLNQYSNGTAYISVQVSDDGGTANGGKDTSGIQTFVITVLPVNQPPYFELDSGLAASQIIYEDATNQVVPNFILLSTISTGPDNEAKQGYSFSVQNDNPALFMTQPSIRNIATNRTYTNYALVYRPKPNSNGVANVRVIMRDAGGTLYGGDNSYTNTFDITVLPVNDPPSATYGRVVYVLEDCGPVTTNWFKNLSTGPAEYHESTQSISRIIVYADVPELFAVQPTVDITGVLSFTPAPNAYGASRVTVNLFDDGPPGGPGDINNVTYSFEIRITGVNDAPWFTVTQNLVQVSYDAGLVRTNVLSFGPGPTNESGQTLTFSLVNNTNKTMFSRQPIIYPNGVLEFAPTNTPAAANKQVTLGIKMTDNGGISYGGVNTTPYVTNLTIRITP